MSNIIDKIQVSGVTYDIGGTGGGGNPTVELTQAGYDALVTAGTVSADTYYIITDAEAGDLTKYWTSAQTQSAITEATSGKASQSDVETVSGQVANKQDTLVSGTNIKTINNTSLLGSGNIDIQGGGGKAIEAGRGIAITTGETADTVSFDLPIYKTVSGTAFSLVLNTSSEPSASTYKAKYNTYINCTSPYVAVNSGTRNLIMGEACSAMSYASDSFVGGHNSKIGDMRTFAFGGGSEALSVGAVAFGYDGQAFKPQVSKGIGSFACGGGTSANTAYSFATGYHNFTSRRSEFASGQYNNSVSATTTFGDSGNTLFSVGNGTADNARHNAFEIRQNGDIYIQSGNTDIKLQDALGGGGSSYTAGDGIDITNDVISVNSGVVTTNTDQDITGVKTFVGEKRINFKQSTNSNKLGFTLYNSASTDNELASFELRPNTFAIDGVQHPLLYFGHYRNTNTANAGVPQTVVGFRQYDQLNAAAYHYLMPLPEKAKTPFNLTKSFKDYYAPMGFKNGSTMITTDNTGVVDLSSELGGLKLVKLSQSEYDSLTTKDNSTLYVIVN